MSEAVRHVLDKYPGRMIDEDELVCSVQQLLARRGMYFRVDCRWTDFERTALRIEYSKRYTNVPEVVGLDNSPFGYPYRVGVNMSYGP